AGRERHPVGEIALARPGRTEDQQERRASVDYAAHGTSPRQERRVASGASTTRTSERRSVRNTGTRACASVSSGLAAGCRKRLSRPQERTAARGRTARTNSDAVDVRLPWWATLRRSAGSTRPAWSNSFSVAIPASPVNSARRRSRSKTTTRDWLLV